MHRFYNYYHQAFSRKSLLFLLIPLSIFSLFIQYFLFGHLGWSIGFPIFILGFLSLINLSYLISLALLSHINCVSFTGILFILMSAFVIQPQNLILIENLPIFFQAIFLIFFLLIFTLGFFRADLNKVGQKRELSLLTVFIAMPILIPVSIDFFTLRDLPMYKDLLHQNEFYHLSKGKMSVYSRDKKDLDLFSELYDQLPESYQKLKVDFRFIEKEECPDILNSEAAFHFWGIGGSRIIILKEDFDDDINILIHELTHALQYQQYGGFLCYFKPRWKIEGEATLVGENISLESFNKAMKAGLKEDPFSFGSRLKEDYFSALAQTWYYQKYLGLSSEEFFEDKISLAPWEKVHTAWKESSQNSL